ncbi:protein kinase domain-containing protein [Planctomicrobium sp. SH661]|uniref:serine/threonine-protein kinase n=1 Tax=Planctomicrobium sp. SH661 TaxID=3448124 RepID=UPI003F5BDB48
MTSQTPSSINSRWIWPFEIIEQIGEGGMGVVYRARYVVNGRQVALKMLPGDISDKTALARFEREVEVLKTLKHPNIVRCFGGVCEDKRRFYAMELLEGGSLEDQLIAKGKLPWELVIQYGLQMCAALEYSHEKGVVHRDVKPSNFLISPTGDLKLSDFGLASVTAARRITAAGKTAGTFLYMAPEQIRGQDVTPRTDLYALGCVLYELVTGQVPFIGETPGATLHLHCSAIPARPSEKALDCPHLLEVVILKLLEKDPDNRCKSAGEVARDLRAISQTVTVTPRKKGSGNQYPIGYDEATKAAVDIQKRTVPLSVGSVPVVSGKILLVCAAILAASCFLNAYQWSRISSLHHSEQLWQTAFQSENRDVHRHASHALGELADHGSENLKLLRAGLQDPQPERRAAAIEGLARAAGSGASAVPELIKLQKEDEDPAVRDAASGAIMIIQNSQKKNEFPWMKLISLIMVLGSIGACYAFWLKQQAAANAPAALTKSH